MKTATGGKPPNRLTKDGARSYRACAPLLKHLAKTRGVDPSQLTREIQGVRRSPIAETGRIIHGLAAGGKTDPGPLLFHLHQMAARGFAERTVEGCWLHYERLCRAETEEQGRGDLAQLEARSHRSAESLDQVEEDLSRHGARIITLVSYIPVLRWST